MGLLVDGAWHTGWYDTKSTGGAFVRSRSTFRDTITADAGDRFPAAPQRYRLYVSYACPWAHRTLIVRAFKGLEEAIPVSVVHPLMLSQGWTFEPDFPGATGDSLYGLGHLHELYSLADRQFTGRVTVPVLWDQETRTIVNNESSEIIRMLGSAFDHLGARPLDLYPEALRAEIDAVNDDVYTHINNGVYRCGFATTQSAYDEAFGALFGALDRVEARLAKQRYLAGERFTEADIRLFTTLVRFDAVYVGHFKCNRSRIADFPNLSNYLREVYQMPGVAETVRMDHIKDHYYRSHRSINPHGVVPRGPVLDFDAPHDRARLTGLPLFG